MKQSGFRAPGCRPGVVHSRFAADPKTGLDPMRRSTIPARGLERLRVDPHRTLRFAMAVSAGKPCRPGQLLQTSQRLPSGGDSTRRVDLNCRGWCADDHGRPRRRFARRDGGVLVTFPNTESPWPVSNSSYADTAGVAVKVAEVFGQQAKSPDAGFIS